MTTNEQARADHECSACFGTGEGNACGLDHGAATCSAHNCCNCEQTFDDVRLNGFACPACRGSGHISDRMPAADAMADAETLRRVARAFYRGFAYQHSDIAKAGSLSDAAFLADGCPGTYLGGYWSEQAAKKAFRAVPGLRGA